MAGQLPASAFAVVTASGGGTKDFPALIIVTICAALIPTRSATMANRLAPARIQMRFFDFVFGAVESRGRESSSPTEADS
jgi:hypothetical protein